MGQWTTGDEAVEVLEAIDSTPRQHTASADGTRNVDRRRCHLRLCDMEGQRYGK